MLHQYPYRDLPFAEDLGREVRRFSVHAFVLTQPEYDALVEALESEGPGTLIHPWYGSVFVQHDGQQSVTYPRAEGGPQDCRPVPAGYRQLMAGRQKPECGQFGRDAGFPGNQPPG